MKFLNQKLNKQDSNKKGFTLIEMMLSLSIFSIVLVVIMGSIITIIDVNRKARSLSIVMNDVNFAMESFTRSLRTGRLDRTWLDDTDRSGDKMDSTNLEILDQNNNEIEYNFVDGGSDNGYIERTIKRASGGQPETIKLTSDQVDIKNVLFTIFYGNDNRQPRVRVLIEGEVKTGPNISSEFKIQTTISQRNLDRQFMLNP